MSETNEEWCEAGQTDKAWCDHCAVIREREVYAETVRLRERVQKLEAALGLYADSANWLNDFCDTWHEDYGFQPAQEALK